MVQHRLLVGVQRAALQALQKQPHGVQRLAQVVAGRRQEARLVAVGFFGDLLRRLGALGLGAQLSHQALVFQFQGNAAAGGCIGRAGLHAGQAEIHQHRNSAGHSTGPPARAMASSTLPMAQLR